MNLTRQPLFKDAHNFFRSTRGRLSETCIIQHNSGDTVFKQSMSSMNKELDREPEQGVGSNPSVLTPVRD